METWKALLFAGAALALALGTGRTERWAVAIAVAAALGAASWRAVLPRADIAEAHNAFLVIGEGEALQRGLPPQVFRSWKMQFDALYPPDPMPYEPRSQWRASGVPRTLFTTSADAIWRRARYTRQVDAIRFRSLADFRGGFANEPQYNFWSGELLREQMPFYVMYQLTPASAGSRLAWTGQVFWERGPGEYEEIVHRGLAARQITDADAGRRVYAAFFPKRGERFAFELQPSPGLRMSRLVSDVAAAGAAVVIVLATVRLRWRSWLRALAVFSAGYAVMASFVAVSAGKYLGRTYPPHGGGDDGLVHDGWGRAMAMLAGRGDLIEALKGVEPVYWFTPGTRYVRMLEKLMFGDTNHLFALLVACIPIAVFYLFRHFIGSWGAALATVACLVLPVGKLSFLQYVANAKLGYGEAIAVGAFLTGAVLLLRTQPAWGGRERSLAVISCAGAALALAVFVRPNFALAVVWMGAMYAWLTHRRGDYTALVAFAAALGLALWMPYHNWYYGGQFHLISGSADVAVPIGPREYVNALADAVSGRTDTGAASVVARQLSGWLLAPGFVPREVLRPLAWVAHGLGLLGLAATVAVVFTSGRRRRWSSDGLAVVAMSALLAHVPMLFVHSPHYRYAMLGWDLSMVVLVVSLWRRSARAGSVHAPVAVL